MASYLLIFLAAVLWGLIGIFSKGALAAGLSPLEIAFWRALLGGALFMAHAGLTGGLTVQRRADALPFAGFAIVGVTLFYASLNLAIDRGGVSLAWILLYTAPAFVVLAARLFLGEALGPRKLALTAATLLGVVLVSLSGGAGIRSTPGAIFWGLMSGLSYASYYIFGKWVLHRYRPATVYALVLPLGALALLPLVHFAPKSPRVWLLLLLLAVVSTYLAYLLYYLGLRRVEASRAVLIATVEPVVAAVVAAALYGERFGALGFLGGALILCASALAAVPARAGRPGARRDAPAPESSGR